MAPAVMMRPSPAITSVLTPTTMPGVTPSITSGFPPFPIPAMLPSLIPMSACEGREVSFAEAHQVRGIAHLVDAVPVDDKRVRDNEIECLRVGKAGSLSHTFTNDLACHREEISSNPRTAVEEEASPPPNLSSSPYTVLSSSTSIHSSVSPSLTLSPFVGPYMLL